MKMSINAMERQNKLEEIMKYMDTFLQLYEENSWLENAANTDIDNAFTLAVLLENIYSKLQETDSMEIVQRQILGYWKIKGRISPGEIAVFEEACDLLLSSCFGYEKLKLEILQHAVLVYEQKCGKERLIDLLSHLLKEGVSCKVLLFFISNNPQTPSLSTVLNIVWHNMAECGQTTYVRDAATLALEQDWNTISVLMEILVKSDPDDQHHALKSILFDVIMSKMRKEIELSNKFYLHLINDVDFKLLIGMCNNYPQFLSVFLSGLQNVALDMKLECKRELGQGVHYVWSDPIKPLNLIKELCSCQSVVASRTVQWLDELQKRPGCSLWEDVAAFCLE